MRRILIWEKKKAGPAKQEKQNIIMTHEYKILHKSLWLGSPEVHFSISKPQALYLTANDSGREEH
jgi:hypothetical protein